MILPMLVRTSAPKHAESFGIIILASFGNFSWRRSTKRRVPHRQRRHSRNLRQPHTLMKRHHRTNRVIGIEWRKSSPRKDRHSRKSTWLVGLRMLMAWSTAFPTPTTASSPLRLEGSISASILWIVRFITLRHVIESALSAKICAIPIKATNELLALGCGRDLPWAKGHRIWPL